MNIPSFSLPSMQNATSLELGGHQLQILPDRTVYWPAERALLLADLHLGKATHFRKHGVYLPGDVIQKELWRLRQSILKDDLDTVYILGDLFHASYNHEWPLFVQLMREHTHLRWVLLKGNHDVLGRGTYEEAGFEVVDDRLSVGNMILAHKPEAVATLADDQFAIVGHIHPGYVLGAKGLPGKVQMPCSWLSDRRLVLPAWGSFTGLDIVQPKAGDRLFLLTENAVWPHKV